MEVNLGWVDWFDSETALKSGVFLLYRNYYLNLDNGEYVYTFPLLPGTVNWSPGLIDTTPIARGITVYYTNSLTLESNLYELLSKDLYYSTENIYYKYFWLVYPLLLLKHNQKPFPDPEKVAGPIILMQHVQKENDLLTESEKYYSECKDEKDREIKSQIRGFVKGYLNWVTVKYKNLISKQVHQRAVASHFPSVKETGSNKTILDHWTLYNLWKKSDNHYDAVMLRLTRESYPELNRHFARKVESNYCWNKFYGSNSYLAGFIYTCQKNGWITYEISAPDIIQIIKNTFHITVDSTPYKSSHTRAEEINDKYMIPFIMYINTTDI